MRKNRSAPGKRFFAAEYCAMTGVSMSTGRILPMGWTASGAGPVQGPVQTRPLSPTDLAPEASASSLRAQGLLLGHLTEQGATPARITLWGLGQCTGVESPIFMDACGKSVRGVASHVQGGATWDSSVAGFVGAVTQRT